MIHTRLTAAFALTILSLTTLISPAVAQTWPSKQVTIVVPFGAGSTPDTMARLMAEQLQKKLGQTFIVENKPGAGGNIGTNVVAKAAADGATLGISIMGPLVVNPMIMKSVPYDPVKDVTPVSQIASQAGALVVAPASGIASVEDLVAKLKSSSSTLTYGSIGRGSVSHLAMALIAAQAGGKPAHIPFAGSPPAVTALIRGDVQMAVLPIGAVGELVKDKKLTLLAVTTPNRSVFFPDAPTLAEKGIKGAEADAWTGFIAPAGIDAALLAKISAEVIAAMRTPAVADKLREQYIEVAGTDAAAFAAFLASERARWAPVIQANGITAE
jgi:tripartite-type tricarboxylate transporter receptor subunit TctC